MKSIRLVCVFILMLVMASCKSNQEKAEDLIRKDMSTLLDDFESYIPISTLIMKQVTMPPIKDTTCMRLIFSVHCLMKEWEIHNEASKTAQCGMEIWGPPTEYSSSYSDKQYYKYRKQFLEEYNLGIKSLSEGVERGIELEQQVQRLDTTQVIGWEICHEFRCKTLNGSYKLCKFRYIIDNDFKKIILREDLDDEDYQEINEVIDRASTSHYTKLKEALKDIIQKKNE